MVITYNGQGNADVKKIKVQGEREKEKEVIVHHEIGSPKWRTWNHDDFSRDWQENYSV